MRNTQGFPPDPENTDIPLHTRLIWSVNEQKPTNAHNQQTSGMFCCQPLHFENCPDFQKAAKTLSLKYV